MSASNKLVLTQTDFQRLEQLVEQLRERTGSAPTTLDTLEQGLGNALIVPEQQIASDIVTMNSKAELRDLESQDILEVTLVYPSDSNTKAGKVSVVGPIGVALLGSRIGDEVEWPTPARTRRFKVVRIASRANAANDS